MCGKVSFLELSSDEYVPPCDLLSTYSLLASCFKLSVVGAIALHCHHKFKVIADYLGTSLNHNETSLGTLIWIYTAVHFILIPWHLYIFFLAGWGYAARCRIPSLRSYKSTENISGCQPERRLLPHDATHNALPFTLARHLAGTPHKGEQSPQTFIWYPPDWWFLNVHPLNVHPLCLLEPQFPSGPFSLSIAGWNPDDREEIERGTGDSATSAFSAIIFGAPT